MAALGANEMVVVVTGGDPIDRAHLPTLPPGTLVIAADSGIDHAHALGLRVDIGIGDFDSVSAEGMARAMADGAVLERHPAEKDATDLELALDVARARRPERILLLGGHGGRLDHLLANALLLAAPAYAGIELSAQMGPARVTVIHTAGLLTGAPGDIVTLLAAHGPATGISTTGLRYPLADEDLQPGSSRGVSNELTEDHATVSVTGGVVLAVQPGSINARHEESTA